MASAEARASDEAWFAGARRREVPDEVDLVDVATLDRSTHAIHGDGIFSPAPGRLPRAHGQDVESPHTKTISGSIVFILANSVRGGPDEARRQREGRARLGGRRHARTADRLREPVSEVEVRDELLPAGSKEPVVAQPLLDPSERPFGLVKLERRPRRPTSHPATPGSDG